MKYRIRLSVTRVIEAEDESAALGKGLATARDLGMDPEIDLLGLCQTDHLDVHSVGQPTGSKMR